MPDHLSFLRIRGLAENDTEVFQGIGAAYSTAAENAADAQPPTPEAEKETFDLGNAWEAQNQFSKTLIGFLASLDPGQNTDAGSIVSDFVSLLEVTQELDASVDAFNIQRAVLGELPVIWQTLNRLPSKEEVEFVQEADKYAESLETWFEHGLTALYDRDTAMDAIDAAKALLSAATTEAETATAQTALDAANAKLETAEGDITANERQLPVDTLPQKMVALMVLARAVMTGNWMLVGVTLVRIAVPLLIDYIAKWIGGKLPGRKPQAKDLQPIVDALRDLALKDTKLQFGDHIEIHEKAAILYEQ
jgi:hypothetical protein